MFACDGHAPLELSRIAHTVVRAPRLGESHGSADRASAFSVGALALLNRVPLTVVVGGRPNAYALPAVERFVGDRDRVLPPLVSGFVAGLCFLETGPGVIPVPLEQEPDYSFDACFSRSCLSWADLLRDEPAVRPREPAGVREEALRFREPFPVFVPDFGSGFAGRLDELALGVLDFAGAPDGDVALRVVAFRAFPGPSFATAFFAAVFVDVLVFPGVRA